MKRTHAALAVLLLFVAVLFAQSPAGQDSKAGQKPPAQGKAEQPLRLDQQPPAEQQPAVTFTTKSELVLIPVMVRKDGVHVPGLKKGDFRVLENGVEKKIAIFEEVRTSKPNAVAPPPLAPGEFSNAAAVGQTAPQGLTLIVLCGYYGSMTNQLLAQEQLLKYLESWTKTREPISVMVLKPFGELYSIYDYTSDPNLLVAAVRNIDARKIASKHARIVPPDASQAPRTPEAQAIERLTTELSDFRSFGGYTLTLAEYDPNADYEILDTMRWLAQAYGGIPGRKSLIWVDGQLPDVAPHPGLVSGEHLLRRDYIERTWKMLNAGNIAVYPIDSRGLANPLFTMSRSAPDPGYYQSAMRTFTQSQNSMWYFADATGGRYFTNRNDLDKAYESAVKDSGDSYLLGYYFKRDRPAAAKSKDKNYLDYRKLQVKVAMKGVEVQARQGFAVGAGTDLQDLAKSAREEEATAIRSGRDYTAIQFSGKWGPVTAGKDGKKLVEFELKLPAGFARLDEANGNRLDVDFVAAAKSPTGEVVTQASRQLQVRIPAAQLPQYFRTGTVYRYVLELPPGEYTVRFIVRDNLTGQMGSVTTPLKVS